MAKITCRCPIKSLAIVGAGGNGSWLAHHIHDMIELGQITGLDVTLFDADQVEMKNIRYQNFTKVDLLENKAEILAKRYKMNYEPIFVTKLSQIEKFDIIIGAVDNGAFRKLLYSANDPFYWIDLRAEGRAVELYTKHKKNTKEMLLETIPSVEGSSSCQLEYELSAGIVQLGNKIAALIGTQFLLNHLRGETNPPHFMQYF